MTNAYSGNDDKADASTRVLRTETGGSGSAPNVSDVKEEVTQKAGEAVDKFKQQAGTQLDTQKGRVSETLGSVALAIRQTGTQLHDQDQGNIAMYTDKAAEQIERLSTYVRDADIGQIAGELERFARRQPALFLGGALALGLFGARFLKSSGQQNQQDWEGYSRGTRDYSSRSMGGYSYSGSSYAGSPYSGNVSADSGYAGNAGNVSADSPYIDRSYGADYQNEGSTTDESTMSAGSAGESNVRQRTWTGTTLEES